MIAVAFPRCNPGVDPAILRKKEHRVGALRKRSQVIEVSLTHGCRSHNHGIGSGNLFEEYLSRQVL